MHILQNKKAIALILVYLMVSVIAIMLAAAYWMNIQSMREAEKRQNWNRAFYAAESGIDSALTNLPITTGSSGAPLYTVSGSLGAPANSQYIADIYEFPAGDIEPFEKWRITSTGYVPNSTAAPRYEVELEVIVEEPNNLPDQFYDYALYSAGDITTSGSPDIVGDAFYSGTIDNTPDRISGGETQGTAIDFLNDIDYNTLRSIAVNQQLSDGLTHVVNLDTGSWGAPPPLPNTFWYDPPTNSIPNVIYVEGSAGLSISGGSDFGGFVIIATSGDCSIEGNLTINGCIFVQDDLKLAGSADIVGGVWAGNINPADPDNGIFVGGSATVTYNQSYMDAIQNLMANHNATVVSWQEIARRVN